MNKSYCLTCGTNSKELKEGTVGITISKSELKNREHLLEEGERICLCKNCYDELAI